jgi:dTDP-4-dehydrorhamnose reductase
MKKILLLGYSGKVGNAIYEVFKNDYVIIKKNSSNLNAVDFVAVENVIKEEAPDIVINCIAKVGLSSCEQSPQEALVLNTLLPRRLAELSIIYDFLLVHFSTGAVLPNSDGRYLLESDIPKPVNIYGFTKFGGDCFVEQISKRYYIIRLPLLFGKTSKPLSECKQFVDNILYRIENGEKEIRISVDVINSPTYTKDVAETVKMIIEKNMEYGLYHVSNKGKVSLYEFTKELIGILYPEVVIQKTTIEEFTDILQNKCCPITSEKIDDLRDWKEALNEYCIEYRSKNE